MSQHRFEAHGKAIMAAAALRAAAVATSCRALPGRTAGEPPTDASQVDATTVIFRCAGGIELGNGYRFRGFRESRGFSVTDFLSESNPERTVDVFR